VLVSASEAALQASLRNANPVHLPRLKRWKESSVSFTDQRGIVTLQTLPGCDLLIAVGPNISLSLSRAAHLTVPDIKELLIAISLARPWPTHEKQ
jgi:hypothetical protein